MSHSHIGSSTEDMHVSAEMNHRICNNLALLASIIQADGRAVQDPHAAFVLDMTRRRLHAIASVHRRLYRSDLHSTIDLGIFLEELGGDLREVCEHSERRRLRISRDSIPISAECAAAFGMLVVELVGNACKHAYPIDEPGEVRVAFRCFARWRLAACGRRRWCRLR